MSEKGVRSVCTSFQGSKILGGKSVEAARIPFLGSKVLVVRALRQPAFYSLGQKILGGKSVGIVLVFLSGVKDSWW